MRRHGRPLRRPGQDGHRRDANEPDIVRALRRVGATVELLALKDVSDLLVGFQGVNYLLEVKSETGELEPGQARWQREWRGRRPCVVRDELEALRAIGAIGGP